VAGLATETRQAWRFRAKSEDREDLKAAPGRRTPKKEMRRRLEGLAGGAPRAAHLRRTGPTKARIQRRAHVQRRHVGHPGYPTGEKRDPRSAWDHGWVEAEEGGGGANLRTWVQRAGPYEEKRRADEVPAMAHRGVDRLGRQSLQPEERAGGQPPESKHQGGAKVPHSKIR
jgi:hypothetical protein